MQKLILSLLLVTLFVGLAVPVTAGIPRYISRNLDYASVSYSNDGSFHAAAVFNADRHNARFRPVHAYAYALSRSPAPTFRSMPASAFSSSRYCTYVSVAPPYGGFNRGYGYHKQYYRCS